MAIRQRYVAQSVTNHRDLRQSVCIKSGFQIVVSGARKNQILKNGPRQPELSWGIAIVPTSEQ
jgi:hypothetical protein